MRNMRGGMGGSHQYTGFFSIDPDLYTEPDPEFGEQGMVEGSEAGTLYDWMGLFARLWGWSDQQFLQMPVRRRKKMLAVLRYQVEKLKIPETKI